ncbi:MULTISPECIES: helix-turn-helix domain-containing protein [unclassified Rhizobium]|uniref:helix-turn-helix domain-containing protein n=1 Tax=unclassified Rhizobium TaxID=2613769 RepID=UPI001911080F|nr:MULTISPECIES: AraC family transcriptional regulator [unclassified Rhizobium]
MTYLHSMVTRTEGIRPVAPERWRSFEGAVGVYWDAEGMAGAEGYYLSPDPRIVVFFNDVSSRIRIASREGALGRDDRPMTRAIYVPAGVPLWTRFNGTHRFSHLDLHIHQDRLLRSLAPSLGSSKSRAVLKRPVELQDLGPIETLAGLVVDEISQPSRHAVFGENLVGSIATALLELPAETAQPTNGRLTQAQMNKLIARVILRGERPMAVAEMAETVGLSESWFATVFRQTTGKSPLQWQMGRRIEAAQNLLADTQLSIADIAAQLGFSDQAHLTKVFRQMVGETPAAWRRLNQRA